MSTPRYTVDDFNDIPGLEPGRNGAGPDRDSWLPLNALARGEHVPVDQLDPVWVKRYGIRP
jgi:hypothetical protein